MAVLGGSPLGIIGVKSVPTNGMSGFNGGASRNVNVSNYNSSKSGKGGGGESLFTGRRRLRAWPNISESKSTGSFSRDSGKDTVTSQDTTGLSDVFVGKDGKLVDNYKSSIKPGAKGSNLLHNNDVYDTSILNILEKLAPTKAALRPTDFAYLKHVGVYPNNRLMIARRFVSPSGDNIMVKRDSKEIPSIATLISWVPENAESFVEITFGEEWVEARADFTQMLNNLGDDFSKKTLGGIAGAGGNALPLPGFTEIFQRKFLEELGLLEEGSSNQIPSGNPNLIKQAKVRKTVPYGAAESGLTATISITMTCEYELKFIAGIDPTMVWMDIIGMITRFGTSESANYGLSQGTAAKMGRWAANPYTLIEDIIVGIKSAIDGAKEQLIAALSKVRYQAYKAADAAEAALKDTETAKETGANAAKKLANAAYDEGKALVDKLVGIGIDTIRASVMKYRVEVMGIVNALSGNPSTPWHITVGNPLRPVFCSGDMLTQSVTLKLGPILAFNDLPSSITATFQLQNARPLGMQEIMAKFNSGYLRTVDVQKTFFETTSTTEKSEPAGVLPGEWEYKEEIPVAGTASGTGVVNQGGSPISGSPSSATPSPAPAATVAATPGPISPAPAVPTQSPVPGQTSVQGTAVPSTEQTKLEGGAKK